VRTEFRIVPIDGWGFHETVDGKLAAAFDAKVIASQFEFHPRIIGWKAKAVNGKYAGCYLELTPRHVEWTEVVVIHIYPNPDDRNYLYSGMADTPGLKCEWLNRAKPFRG
jgi:hypothetical protein